MTAVDHSDMDVSEERVNVPGRCDGNDPAIFARQHATRVQNAGLLRREQIKFGVRLDTGSTAFLVPLKLALLATCTTLSDTFQISPVCAQAFCSCLLDRCQGRRGDGFLHRIQPNGIPTLLFDPDKAAHWSIAIKLQSTQLLDRAEVRRDGLPGITRHWRTIFTALVRLRNVETTSTAEGAIIPSLKVVVLHPSERRNRCLWRGLLSLAGLVCIHIHLHPHFFGLWYISRVRV